MKMNQSKVLCSLQFCILMTLALSAQNQVVLSIAVSSGNFERHNSAVSVSLEGTGLSTTSTHYELVEVGKQEETRVHFQLDQN